MISITAIWNAICAGWSTVWPYLVAALVFLLLIVIHEFGHFIVAKLMGVRVNAFAVGFGPKLLHKTWGETEYSLNLVPFGGYCEMEGEEEESADERAFCRKPAWRRFLIVAAGACFNLLFGLLLIAVSLAPSDVFPSTTVSKFEENASSAQHGLQVGDRIVGVNGRRVFSTYDLRYAFTVGIGDGTVELEVVRDGKKQTLPDVAFRTETVEGMQTVQVDFFVQPVRKTFGSYLRQTGLTAVSYARMVWLSLVDLVCGRFGISAMSGPVGVTAAIGSVARNSLLDLLLTAALISINLGIFNLLPIPALDGGRLFFLLIELVFRRRVPPNRERLVHAVGLILLLAFMAVITVKDVWSLFAR